MHASGSTFISEDLEEVDFSIEENIRKFVLISSNVTEKEKELVKLLKEYHNVFAWSYQDMLGLDTSMVCHALNGDSNCKPIKQARRNFQPDMEKNIKEEV